MLVIDICVAIRGILTRTGKNLVYCTRTSTYEVYVTTIVRDKKYGAGVYIAPCRDTLHRSTLPTKTVICTIGVNIGQTERSTMAKMRVR